MPHANAGRFFEEVPVSLLPVLPIPDTSRVGNITTISVGR